jgi:plasmid stabilization system protein ParE
VKYKVIVKTAAKADFLEIHGYLKERFGKKSAARFKTTYSKILKALRHTPRMYESVPELPGVHKCAALSPTLVLYQVIETEKRVEILSLYDGRFEQQ